MCSSAVRYNNNNVAANYAVSISMCLRPLCCRSSPICRVFIAFPGCSAAQGNDMAILVYVMGQIWLNLTNWFQVLFYFDNRVSVTCEVLVYCISCQKYAIAKWFSWIEDGKAEIFVSVQI